MTSFLKNIYGEYINLSQIKKFSLIKKNEKILLKMILGPDSIEYAEVDVDQFEEWLSCSTLTNFQPQFRKQNGE